MTRPSITIAAGRHFLTDCIRDEVDWHDTPQSNGEPPPPLQKPAADGAVIIPLPPPQEWQIPPLQSGRRHGPAPAAKRGQIYFPYVRP